jgi:hypothetical protein
MNSKNVKSENSFILPVSNVASADEAATLTGLADIFTSFSPEFIAQTREFHEQDEREWNLR